MNLLRRRPHNLASIDALRAWIPTAREGEEVAVHLLLLELACEELSHLDQGLGFRVSGFEIRVCGMRLRSWIFHNSQG